MPLPLPSPITALRVCALVLVFVLSLLTPDRASRGDAAPGVASPADYETQVRPFFARYCLDCHGPEKPKGDLRLDELAPDFGDRDGRARWRTVQERIEADEMPPKSKPRPPQDEAEALARWINARATDAEAAERARQGRVVLRRLNRLEYENTVRDLLGVHIELKELLPRDSAADGFDNVGAALHSSSFLMERYLEAADTALGVAIANGPQPPLIQKRYLIKDERHVKTTTERVFRQLDDAVVCFSSSPWEAVTLGQFYPPDRGAYRFRISASGFQSAGKPVAYSVVAGSMLMGGKNHLVGYFDAPAETPTVVEFVEALDARSTIRLLPYGLASAQAVDKVGADVYEGAGLAIQWVEVEGPIHESWPPPSHRKIFGDLPQAPAPVVNNRKRVEVISENPEADAERILRGFARRAFRRTVTDADVAPFVALFQAKRREGCSFEQAVRVGLMGVMLAPDFLFLRERPGKLDDFALASRLSYFLWSTMPDEALLALAEEGVLARPETLHSQVERMLADPRAAAFTTNFVGQWLGLRDIDFTMPSHLLYPEFDDMLKASMVAETEGFFNEVLKHDLSLTSFVDADFAMLNGRLAKHYGITIPGAAVAGWQIEKVALPPGSHRGGLLTMASVLKVTANGTSTSPVLRGAWVLDRILGTPPPRPPAGVAAVEPDIRGATTIREQLAKHRQVASCAACHDRIDPLGFALESYDVIGGWRENYRTTGRGQAVFQDGRRMNYLKGPKVDPSSVLPDGQPFQDIDELKRLLLRDQDQLARALAEKLLIYATGGAVAEADRPAVAAIVARIREQGYGLRTLVHEVVQSPLFQNK
jgi:mono/diheme cytochrome c family protein